MNRRSFFSVLAALPIFGKYLAAAPKPASAVAFKSYTSSITLTGASTTHGDIKKWVQMNLDRALQYAQHKMDLYPWGNSSPERDKAWQEAHRRWGYKAPLVWDEQRQAYLRFLRRDPRRLP